MELKPFREAIKADVDAIMTAHILLPGIDPEYPATLSRKVLNGLLRKQMGFNGLIISDAMSMDAISKHFGTKKAVIRAVQAGVDILLLPSDPNSIFNIIQQAVERGEISMGRIDEAVERILKLKSKLNLHKRRTANIDQLLTRLANPEVLERVRKKTCDSVTFLRRDGISFLFVKRNKERFLASYSRG